MVLTEGTRAVVRWDNLVRRPVPGPGGGRRRAQAPRTRGHHPARPDDTSAGPGCPDRWLPSVVPGAESGTSQCADRPTDPDFPGPGRHHQLVFGTDRGVDEHLGRSRPADRAGDQQPQHRARLAGRSEQAIRQGGDLVIRAGEALADRKGDISNGLAYANAAAATVADLLQQARPPFQKTVHEADRAAGIVVADHDYVDNLLNTLPDKYQVLARQGLYGDFFSFYLCDLVLKVNGKGGQPVYIKVAGQTTGRCAPK